jgi:hypothetical protein
MNDYVEEEVEKLFLDLRNRNANLLVEEDKILH